MAPLLTIHPVAAMFPLLQGKDFDDLCESIRKNGLIHSGVRCGNELLDGRNRQAACNKVGVPFRCVEFSDPRLTPAEWILATNLARRHLSEDQRLAIARKAMGFIEDEIEERKRESRFRAGEDARRNVSHGPKKLANPKSGSPARDIEQMHAKSAAGRLAKAAGTSRYKAEQAIKVGKAIANGALPADTDRRLVEGAITIAQAEKEISKPKISKEQQEAEDRADAIKWTMKRLSDLVVLWAGPVSTMMNSGIVDEIDLDRIGKGKYPITPDSLDECSENIRVIALKLRERINREFKET